MDDVLGLLSSGPFMPHGHCYLWTPGLVWLQVIANGLTGLAYFWISGTLVHIIHRIRDLPFERVFIAFGIFIVSCGMTHFMDVVVIWHPVYWLDGGIRAVTAFASVATGLLMVPLIPRVLALAETSRVAHERGIELERVNEDLATLMAQTKARYHEVLAESLPTIVWVTDAKGEVEYFNQRWYVYTGQDPAMKEGEGWGWLPVLDPAQHDETVRRWQHCVTTGEAYEIEYRLKRADGTYRWHRSRGLPFRDETGAIVRWFGTCSDIDEQKRIAEQREALVKDLERSVQLREEFLSIVSHELRTPVTTLGLQTEAIERALDAVPFDPSRVRASATRISRQVQRLERLTSDLLDISRLKGGDVTFDTEELDVVELVEEALADVPSATLTPAPSGAIRVRGDRSRLLQVLENILTNAVKFGGEKPITVSIASGPEAVRIAIRDEGIGIAPADQSRIFSRFERAVSERNYGGLGLGLWIAWEIVSSLGGTIELQSSLGAGSTFTVVLPKEQPVR